MAIPQPHPPPANDPTGVDPRPAGKAVGVPTPRDSASPIRPGEYIPTADQRVIVHGASWAHYEAHLAMRGERSVPRISYLRGTLELMSPSRGHERITSWIGRLIEVYAEERNIQLAPTAAGP